METMEVAKCPICDKLIFDKLVLKVPFVDGVETRVCSKCFDIVAANNFKYSFVPHIATLIKDEEVLLFTADTEEELKKHVESLIDSSIQSIAETGGFHNNSVGLCAVNRNSGKWSILGTAYNLTKGTYPSYLEEVEKFEKVNHIY